MSLEDRWRAATGKEPPVLTDEEVADFDARLEKAEQQWQRIYGADAEAA